MNRGLVVLLLKKVACPNTIFNYYYLQKLEEREHISLYQHPQYLVRKLHLIHLESRQVMDLSFLQILLVDWTIDNLEGEVLLYLWKQRMHKLHQIGSMFQEFQAWKLLNFHQIFQSLGSSLRWIHGLRFLSVLLHFTIAHPLNQMMHMDYHFNWLKLFN